MQHTGINIMAKVFAFVMCFECIASFCKRCDAFCILCAILGFVCKVLKMWVSNCNNCRDRDSEWRIASHSHWKEKSLIWQQCPETKHMDLHQKRVKTDEQLLSEDWLVMSYQRVKITNLCYYCFFTKWTPSLRVLVRLLWLLGSDGVIEERFADETLSCVRNLPSVLHTQITAVI